MACSKYTLTNTGSTVVNFNYRKCDDSMWQYQVNLDPNETKNIWLINGTYDVAQSFESKIVLVNDGVYPLTPTPTRTPTPTPSPTTTTTPTPTITPTTTITPTNTQTPTITPTITPTASQTFFFTYYLGFDPSNSLDACAGTLDPYYLGYFFRPEPSLGERIYINNTLTTPAPDGFYSNGTAWWQVTGGSGLITSTDPNGC